MGRAPQEVQTTVHYQYMVQLRGKTVGTIQRFNPSSDKDLQRIAEIMGPSGNDYVEIAPGRTSTQLMVDRLEMDGNCMAQIISGDDNYLTIEDLNEPIDIVEIMYPSGGGKTRKRTYSRCWVKSHSKTVTVDAISVTESVTFWVTNVFGEVS